MAKKKKSSVAPTQEDLTTLNLDDLRERWKLLVEQHEEIDHWETEQLKESSARIKAFASEIEVRELLIMRDAMLGVPSVGAHVEEATIDDIDIDLIDITGNHRDSEDNAEVERLAGSIASIGLQSPIGVRLASDGRFELIYGSRRLMACKQLKLQRIRATCFPTSMSQAEVELRRTAENFARREISPSEQALAVARMIESVTESVGDPMFNQRFDVRTANAVTVAGGVNEYVGQLLGRSVSWVKDHAYVTKLGGEARALLRQRRIDLGHARELAKLGDKVAANQLAKEVSRNEEGIGGRSVEYLKRRVTDFLASLSRAPWNLDVTFPGIAEKGGIQGPCAGCAFNSKTDPDLFGMVGSDGKAGVCSHGVCSHKVCFNVRMEESQKLIDVAVKKCLKHGGGDANKFTPLTIKASTFARAVKRATEGVSSGAAPAKEAGPTPEQIAERAHEAAMDEWHREMEAVIADKIKDMPGAAILWELLRDDVGYKVRAHSRHDRLNALKAVEAKGFENFLSTISNPSFDAITRIEKKRAEKFRLYVGGWIPEALIKVAEALNVKVGPVPQYKTPAELESERQAAADQASGSLKKKHASKT